MTEVQAEALDMVHFTAKAHAVTVKLERGDIEIKPVCILHHVSYVAVESFPATKVFEAERSLTIAGHDHIILLW